jgi:1-acyl-sn-glycerol-3-phosphate acyltransferase
MSRRKKPSITAPTLSSIWRTAPLGGPLTCSERKRVTVTREVSMRHGISSFWYYSLVVVLRPLMWLLTKRVWRGQKNIPRDRGVILAGNHISWYDPLALGYLLYKQGLWPRYLAKSELFKVKMLGSLMRGAGQIPVYRHTSDAGVVLRDAERALNNGACVVFFPEGTCTRDPDLWPMVAKTGAARLALTTGAPVVPVAHWGTHEFLPYGSTRPRLFPRKTVYVTVGPPVDLSAYSDKPLSTETLRAATSDIMVAITSLVAEVRGDQPPPAPFDPQAGTRAKTGAQSESSASKAQQTTRRRA